MSARKLIVSLTSTATAEELYVATLAEHAGDAEVEFLLRVAADRVRSLGVTGLADQTRHALREAQERSGQ